MTIQELKQLDLYKLKGKRKKEVMRELQQLVKKNGANPHVTFKALGILADEADRRIRQLETIGNLHRNKRNAMMHKALEDFKTSAKVEFMTAHKADIEAKNFTPELIHGLERFDKMDKYGCYSMSGLHVRQKDCTTCENKKSCWSRAK